MRRKYQLTKKIKKLLVADETANDPDEHNKTRHITMTRRRSSHKEHCKVEGTDARQAGYAVRSDDIYPWPN